MAAARAAGAAALLRCVFGAVPAAGRWRTVLLADGNIGIGGDPHALLRRIYALLAPGGRVFAEVGPPGTATQRVILRLSSGGRPTEPFAWAQVAVSDAPALAAAAGLVANDCWEVASRWFVALERR